MRNLIFVVACLLFVGTSYAADPNPPPAETINTFEKLIQVNADITAADWQVQDIQSVTTQDGAFVVITYRQDCLEVLYCSDLITDYSTEAFENTSNKIKSDPGDRSIREYVPDNLNRVTNRHTGHESIKAAALRA